MKKTAFCKINLTLEILGTKRGDGFHDLKTVMHKIPLGDIVELSVKDGDGKICLLCDSNVCTPEENLAYRAAKAFLDLYKAKTGKCANVSISLSKITPTGAGLGGGSADAAAVLDMLACELVGVSDSEILDLAGKLGSDVPFCLDRYMSAYCTGRGEICESIDTLPENTCLVVAKPIEGINTKGIYGEYDKAFGDDYSKDASDKMRKALCAGNLSCIADVMTNDFEKVCIPRLPEIEVIKDMMKKDGALCSMMSGSGSAVYGLFDNSDSCAECYDALKAYGLSEVFAFYDADFQKMYTGE